MNQYSSQASLGEPEALSKHLLNVAYASNFAQTRMLTIGVPLTIEIA